MKTSYPPYDSFMGSVAKSARTSESPVSKKRGRTLGLLALLAFLLVTGLLQALWLHNALANDATNPYLEDPSLARNYLLLGLVGPIGTVVVAVFEPPRV
jgi:NhaP-type Na+/H+ or K+/H+ antiporter